MAHANSHLVVKKLTLILSAMMAFSFATFSNVSEAQTKRKPAQTAAKKKAAPKKKTVKKAEKKKLPPKKRNETFEEAPSETITQTIEPAAAPEKARSKASERGEKDVRRDFGISFWIWQEVVEGERQNVTFDLETQHKDLAFSYYWRRPAKFSKLWRHITATGVIVGQVDAKGGVFATDPPEEQFRDQPTVGAYYLRGYVMRTSLQTESIFFGQVMGRKILWGIEDGALLEEVRELYPILLGVGIKLNYDFNFGGSLSFGLNYQPQSDSTMWQFDLTI